VISMMIPNLEDTLETATKFAAGKHLLETALGKPVVLRAAEKVVVVEPPVEAPRAMLYAVATASD
jgi:hypothetical protein